MNLFRKKEDEAQSRLLQSGFRYALALCHNRFDAEDLVQEAWLRLYESKHAKLETGYFLRIIRNLFIDGFRRSKVIQFESLHSGHPAPSQDEEPGYSDLEAALAQLNDKERETLYLSVYENYSAADIAELTGESRNTVLSRLSRAKEKLARLLNENKDFGKGGGP